MSPLPSPAVEDQPSVTDIVLASVVAVVVAVPYVLGGFASGSALGAAFASVLTCAALVVRRTHPPLALAVGTVGALAQLVVSGVPLFAIVVVPVLVYSAARWGRRTISQAGLSLGLVGSVFGPFRWALGSGGFGSTVVYLLMGVVGCGSIVAVAYVVGRRRREGLENQQQRHQSEAERARLLVAEQEQRAAVTAVDERNRIARELHDIVAHSLSVIVVQAEGGRALAIKQPERGPEVLGTIAETSRQALEEMRRMVGLLRSGEGRPEETSYGPAPGLDDVADLVGRTSEHAELVVFGTPPPVSAALGLTAYRIVQESLTNVLKHAGPAARARVTLAYTPSAVEIEVSDDGRGAAAESDGVGHGMRGMHERVALHDGTLSAGPRPSGGYVVRASLPLVPHPEPGVEPGAAR